MSGCSCPRSPCCPPAAGTAWPGRTGAPGSSKPSTPASWADAFITSPARGEPLGHSIGQSVRAPVESRERLGPAHRGQPRAGHRGHRCAPRRRGCTTAQRRRWLRRPGRSRHVRRPLCRPRCARTRPPCTESLHRCRARACPARGRSGWPRRRRRRRGRACPATTQRPSKLSIRLASRLSVATQRRSIPSGTRPIAASISRCVTYSRSRSPRAAIVADSSAI